MSEASNDENAAGEAFWRFSLALYARPGVAEALLCLQDRAGCDVNLMLFALWLGAGRGWRLDAAAQAAAQAAVAPLNRLAVVPLRGLRRQLKSADDPELRLLRRRLAAVELAGERSAQRRLAAGVGRRPGAERDGLAAAAANLARYLGAAAGSPAAAVLRQALASLIRCGSAL